MKPSEIMNESRPGLWANIHAKRERIKHGSGERMRKPGSKGAPSAQDFKDAAKEDVEEAKAATASFRAGNKKRAELNSMSDDERRAYDKEQQEKQRKRDDARLERERQKLAAKKGVAEAMNPAQQAAIAISMKEKGKKPKNEDRDPSEYDMEGDFVKNQIHTIIRVMSHLEKEIGDGDNLPEWVQMKISQAQGMLVGVMDYMISEKERNHEIETGEEGVHEDWQKVNKSDKTDGMSRKAVKAYRRENPGSKLKTAVTTKPSKLKKGSKDANRRKSFCARMSGMKKAHASAKTKRDPNSPINKALRRWNCESIEDMRQLVENAEKNIKNLRKQLK